LVKTYSCKTSDIDTGQECGYLRGWFVQLAKPDEARVWDGDTGFFGVDSGVWEVGRLSKVYANQYTNIHEICQYSPVLLRALKNEDFPTLGRPTEI
jgi:hypothetical protein